MSYLKFDKTRMINLEYSLDREILRTNRRGAYHCTTLVECNTRKQHGLLVMPVPSLNDSNHVILSSFDETVIQHGAEFNLGIHKYDEDNYNPKGNKYIREFNCDSSPRTVYRIGGVILSKEKIFSLEENNILIRYTLLDAHSPTILRFKPFLAFRGINDLSVANDCVQSDYTEIENGISTCMYDGYPKLFMQFNTKVNFEHKPDWYRGIEYREDKEEGLPYKEDLYVPGCFELPIKKGESIIFSASDKPVNTASLLSKFAEEIKRHTPRSSFYNCLKNSAHQFYYRPSKHELYLLAGYPWFGVNAREQFMSLPGLTLYIGKRDAFEDVVDTAIPTIQQLLKKQTITGAIKGMDEPDVLFWLTWALKKYSTERGEDCYRKYGSLVNEIVSFIKKSKHSRLKVLENGLLSVDGEQRPASWMNATAMGKPITPRTGCLIEINAFWYNTLMFNLEIAKALGDTKLENEMIVLSQKVKESFTDVFVNGAGYLFDYVDGDYINWSVRPNMILALSLDYPILNKAQSKRVLDLVTKELLTPKGLRSLSPKSEGYKPYFQGSQYDKDYALFNGMAWPWLFAPFIEAYLKVHQRSALSFIDRIMVGLEEEMGNDCIGSLSQMYDGNPPYTGRGGISYAPNIAGAIRILMLMKSFEQNKD